ncbi:MAG: LamG-like jellyroll fold domain-containing protein [Bacteroidota bacterium]|nr:LamG-like jellyroll fold domain-containing protein [Bacteroidota bacterium]
MADEGIYNLNYIKYLFILTTIILIPIIFEFALRNKSVFDKTYIYVVVSVFIPLLLILAYQYFGQGKAFDPTSLSNYLILFLAILFLVSIFYTQLAMYSTTFTYITYFYTFLFALMVITALAIVFYAFSNYYKSMDGISSYITYIVFYIPCLLIDLAKYLIKELNLTTSPIYMLLLFEALLILAYFYLPKMLEKASKKEGVPVIENTVFLDVETNYSLNEAAKLDLEDKVKNIYTGQDIEKKNRLNYSLSMWLYINNYDAIRTDDMEETNIFNFNNGLPKLTLANSDKESSKIYVYYSNTQTEQEEIFIPFQKWNNVVFNYYSTHVDLFVNGNLEKTFDLDNSNFPDYSNTSLPITNEVVVGGNNEITGAICNVRYYKESLSQRKIANFYNLLKNKNPPTFNV